MWRVKHRKDVVNPNLPDPSLSFEELRRTNAARCEAHFHKIDEWDEVAWGCALGGECGELLNILKKRHRIISKSKYQGGGALEKLKKDAGKELGDLIAYADLVATRLGLRLEDCIVNKFNTVSRRVKSNHRL